MLILTNYTNAGCSFMALSRKQRLRLTWLPENRTACLCFPSPLGGGDRSGDNICEKDCG